MRPARPSRLADDPLVHRDPHRTERQHGLLAVRLLAQVEKAFGKKLPVAIIFQSPTIAQLARILRQGGQT